MVNFDSEQMLTTNKGEILNLIVLGRRDELLNTFQQWRVSCISNGSNKKTVEEKLRGSLFVLFMEIERPLSRKLDKKVFEDLEIFVYSESTDISKVDIISAYHVLNKFLDDINLTKIDTKKNFDSRNLEDENAEKGL